MGAPLGNKNRCKDKLLAAAMRRVLTQNPEDARLIAVAAITKAKEGDIQAAVFVRDTCDGKPDHHIDISSEDLASTVATMTDEELRAHVMGRMAPFLRPALRSLVRDGGDGTPGDKTVN